MLCWIFPYWYTKTNKRALWTIWNSGGSCSCLRSEGDLQSLAPGEDAAEQCHPCLHSFKSVPAVFPSPCAAHPSHRPTKGCIHHWAATSYNPFERQQAVPALPRFVLGFILPCSCEPGAVWADSCACRWVWGSKDQLGWVPWGGKGLPGSASPAEVVTSPVGAQWLPSWELFGFVPTFLPRTSCCTTSLLWMGRTFFAFPASVYSWPACSHLFPCQHWPLA